MYGNILIYFIILIFTLSACNDANVNSNNERYKLTNKLDTTFVEIVNSFIDSVETRWTQKPLLGLDNFYYTVKFFTIKGNVFFTLRTSYIFPEYEFYENEFYKNDTACMYYYEIHNRNLIIIDYFNSKGHGVFSKDLKRNTIAIMRMKENASLINKKSIRPSNPDIYRVTYKVINTINGINLVKLDSIILAPPYKTEINNIQIVDEE